MAGRRGGAGEAPRQRPCRPSRPQRSCSASTKVNSTAGAAATSQPTLASIATEKTINGALTTRGWYLPRAGRPKMAVTCSVGSREPGSRHYRATGYRWMARSASLSARRDPVSIRLAGSKAREGPCSFARVQAEAGRRAVLPTWFQKRLTLPLASLLNSVVGIILNTFRGFPRPAKAGPLSRTACRGGDRDVRIFFNFAIGNRRQRCQSASIS